jgi:hypothetical protein
MTKPRSELKDVPASVHARLLTFAKSEKRDFNQVLTQYFQERLLDRLARSRYDEQFALKGALLFVALESESSAVRGRPTRDIDFEGLKLGPEPEQIRAIFSEIAALPSDPDDGVVFLIKDLEAEQIVEHEEYEGVRVHLPALLGKMRNRVQIDVGFGDAITPKPQRTAFPTLLDEHVPPKLLMYPLETVVAEKVRGGDRSGRGQQPDEGLPRPLRPCDHDALRWSGAHRGGGAHVRTSRNLAGCRFHGHDRRIRAGRQPTVLLGRLSSEGADRHDPGFL